MGRRRKDDERAFDGKFDVKSFDKALEAIQEKNQIPAEETRELLRLSIDKAARDTLEPIQDNAAALHTETVIDEKSGEISFYECKDVVDEVEDDFYQIELADAQKIDPNYKVGDVVKYKKDLAALDYQFFARTIQNFMQKVKEATKKALIDHYSDRVGEIVTGTVDKTESGFVTLMINKVQATLTPKNSIPGEQFLPGDQVKVLLQSIGVNETSSNKNAQLLISRTDNKFLAKLFESEIPDIADHTVVIKDIAREPGNRSKVAVDSNDPEVDPTGACIGSDGSRIKDIVSQLSNEKIDVIRYQENPYLYIAEALKPATVDGVVFLDGEVAAHKAPKAIAIVKNEESKIAIGRRGVNVRLASRLTGYSIDIKEQDDAMKNHISYTRIDDIKRKEALSRLDSDEILDEDDLDIDSNSAALESAVVEADKVSDIEAENDIPSYDSDDEETEFTPSAAETTETKEATTDKEDDANVQKPVEAKENDQDEEHVEITSKAKISISALEAQIERDKKKASTANDHHSSHKNKTDDKKKVVKIDVDNAMPIYTEEELRDIEEEENSDSSNYDDYDEFEEYDSDDYYEDK
ncbi:MAG: transcription termination factor NusA [Bacilli bacterium]|nr:transcription termination factor NusA [Bacilli bacterium]